MLVHTDSDAVIHLVRRDKPNFHKGTNESNNSLKIEAAAGGRRRCCACIPLNLAPMHASCTGGACGLKLLVHEAALGYECMRPEATSAWGLKILVCETSSY